MKKAFKTAVLVSVALLAASLAAPAVASDSFKIGIGGGATFTAGDFSTLYKTGWNGTVRALWVPVPLLGLRVAGYYGQNAPSDSLGGTVKTASLYGADANAVVMLGSGTSGFYFNGGLGFRSLQQKVSLAGGETTTTSSQVSYNAGAGVSMGYLFAEANAVYFSISGVNMWSFPVTVGVQF